MLFYMLQDVMKKKKTVYLDSKCYPTLIVLKGL